MSARRSSDRLDANTHLIENKHAASGQHLQHGSSEQTSNLRRSIPNLVLLICGDVLAILSWCAMLFYALLLWHSHGKREVDLSDRMFDPHLLMEYARPVCVKDSYGQYP